MRVLHLDTEAGWRGGQRQLELLCAEPTATHLVACLPGSPVAAAVARAGARVLPWACRGPGRGVRSLRRWVAEHRPDVIAAHTPHAFQKAWLAGLAGRTIVHRRVDFRPSRASIGRLCQSAGVVAVSGGVRRVLLRAGIPSGLVRVVHDGVVPVAAPSRTPAGRIGAVGALVPHKGHRVLVEASPSLGRPVHIAGEGSERRALEHQVRRLGAPVVFRGQLAGVGPFLATLDLLVHPSIEEGLGQVVLEAMWAGVPVVASDVGGLPEVVQPGDTGWLVPPGDPTALAAAVREVLDHPVEAHRRAQRARQRVAEAFSAHRMAEQTLAAYSGFLGEPR